MIYFLDASALAKRYVAEPGSDRVQALFRRQATLAVARVTQVEVTSALVSRARAGDLDPELADEQCNALADDFLLFEIVELRPPVIERASELVREHGLRAYDSVQLACALRLKTGGTKALSFLCADGELADAADEEGLRVERVGGP